MTVRDVKETLGARIACGEEWLDREVHSACGMLYAKGLRGGADYERYD